MAKYVLGMAVAGAAALAGCMLGPTDGERVASTTDPLPFTGYDTEADGLVQVKAWDFTATATAGIRSAVNSALDTVVHMAGRLGFIGPSLSIDALTLSGNTMTIQPGCAEL